MPSESSKSSLPQPARCAAIVASSFLAALVLVGLIVGAGAGDARAEDGSLVPYPEGYRNWSHVKSMVIHPGHPLHASFGGLHHLYANEKAMKGYRTGQFADGSVIIFDLLEALTADNATVEGQRKVVGVMLRDGKKFAATGGWGFEGFAGDSKSERVVGANAKTACFDCHTARAAQSFVFSEYRQ